MNTWTTNVTPTTQPDFRSGGNMAYDAARKLHILFGSQFTTTRTPGLTTLPKTSGATRPEDPTADRPQ